MNGIPMKHYYELTKSGLVFGNIVAVIAGFLLGQSIAGSGMPVAKAATLAAAIIGLGLVMASGCVFNNYLDRDIDGKMERTKRRALVMRRVSERNAIVFGTVLGVIGFFALAVFTNAIAVAVAGIGFVFYVFIYTIGTKRRSPYGTAMGAIAGATPPVVGYAAAAGRVDLAALILFFIMFTWQMPHFFAIAIRREEDYKAANVPVLPVRSGVARTKLSMAIYIVEFIAASSLLAVFGYAGPTYLAIALALGAVWFVLAVRGFGITGVEHNRRWARSMFFFSLVVMVVLFGTIGIAAFAT